MQKDFINRDNLTKEQIEFRKAICDKETKMNNDLISRSDIKDHIGELLLVYSGADLANAILNAIDNAPTVEPTFGLFREMLCAECGKRPQVKVLIDGEQIYPLNCGADMRGEDHD